MAAFDDYFHIGMLLEVTNERGRFLYIARVEDVLEDSLKLVHSRGNALPMAAFNKHVRIRGFLPGMRPVAAQCTTLRGTKDYWYVGEFTNLFTNESRASFRQPVRIDTFVTSMKDAMDRSVHFYSGETSAEAPCRILDISTAGVLIQCKRDFEVGDCLWFKGVEIVPNTRPVSFSCIVKRRDGERYGCQIEGLSAAEESELSRRILKIQRDAIVRSKVLEQG